MKKFFYKIKVLIVKLFTKKTSPPPVKKPDYQPQIDNMIYEGGPIPPEEDQDN